MVTELRAFWVVCIALFVLLLQPVLALSPLYLDANLRSQTQEAIEAVADDQGWLYSGITITEVKDDTVQLNYRSHVRGEDPVECFSLNLSSNTLSPCE